MGLAVSVPRGGHGGHPGPEVAGATETASFGEKENASKGGKEWDGGNSSPAPKPGKALKASPADEGQGQCTGHAVLGAPGEQQVSEGSHSEG